MSVLDRPGLRALVESGALAFLHTTSAAGAPQVSAIWIGIEGEDIVFASLGARRKLENIARDPRVALALQAPERNAMGLDEYAVIHGEARIEEGGAPELLGRLAQVYIGPGTVFPPMPDPPPGFTVRIAPTRVVGVGPWA